MQVVGKKAPHPAFGPTDDSDAALAAARARGAVNPPNEPARSTPSSPGNTVAVPAPAHGHVRRDSTAQVMNLQELVALIPRSSASTAAAASSASIPALAPEPAGTASPGAAAAAGQSRIVQSASVRTLGGWRCVLRACCVRAR